jgi:ubiquinone/menaquinone biosynthesis C-methylase UbiE
MPWLMAAVYDRILRPAEEAGLAAWRAELLRGLSGDVLEVGAGTGANLPHYPRSIRRLVLTEPDPHMRKRLERKLAEDGEPNGEVADGSLDGLPFPDATFDAVVATLVLCSVGDPARALREVRRVLKPDGRFVFIEHVAGGAGSSLSRWQGRLEPIWKRLAGNCHLTRRTEEALHAAGFTLETIERDAIPKALPWVSPSVRGVARKTSAP